MKNLDPPDEPCANPACGVSVYWPDERSLWVTAWNLEHWRHENPISARTCSLACLIAILQNPAPPTDDTRWGT